MESFREKIEKVKDKIKDNIEQVKTDSKKPTLRRFIVERLGYPLEKHQYMTKDGYINSVYRIPGIKGTKEGQT
jgi:hypothetical protein